MGLLRRPRPQCYYCLSPSPEGTARVSSKWFCSACGCWNVLDSSGEIVGDYPGMRDPALNSKSFSLRAAPSTSRLPAASHASPFCRDCQTNQTLVMNLLGNYLPDESDPSYPALAAELPNYIASLHARYPPVCSKCQPGVDDALKRADQRAQSEAWSRALKRGAKVQQTATGPGWIDIAIWRLRGAAWIVDSVAVVAIGAASWLNAMPLDYSQSWSHSIPWIRAVAILWAFWDPSWLRRARSDGQLRSHGRKAWIYTMATLYLSRLAAAILGAVAPVTHALLLLYCLVDSAVVLFALTQLRLAEPVALTLVRPVAASTPRPPHPTPPPPPPPEPSLNGLSLSNVSAAASHANPVFGQASMQVAQGAEEPMDWEPTGPSRDSWDAFGAGRQRMFSTTSNETGLESLLAGWDIGGTQSGGTQSSVTPAPQVSRAVRLDSLDTAVRNTRVLLLIMRVVALIAIFGSRLVGLSILWNQQSMTAQHYLLAIECAASAMALVVSLVSGRVEAPIAVVLGLDAAIRATALLAPYPTHPPFPNMPEISSLAWTALDALVLAST